MMTHEAAIMVILGKMCDNLPLHRQKDRMERTRDYSPPILKLPDLMIPRPPAGEHARGGEVHNRAHRRGPHLAVYPCQRDKSSLTSDQDKRGQYGKASSTTSPSPSTVQRIPELDATDKEAR